jgi:octaprenyl-diphosphate synthase
MSTGLRTSVTPYADVPPERIFSSIDGDLRRFEEELQSALASEIGLVRDVISHLLIAKGKRFRPALLLLTTRTLGGDAAQAIKAAAALELIHTATLVHDDVVDQASTRRGSVTVNSLWNNKISVLMGDFLYARAVRLLVDIGSLEVMQIVAEVTERLTRGEVMQIGQGRDLSTTEEMYLATIGDKTASLFGGSARLGGIFSGLARKDLDLLSTFGENLGMAFQITDDLLDFVGDAAVLGKPVGSDFRERKVTLPMIHAFKSATLDEADWLKRLFEQEHNDEAELAQVVEFVRARDGIDYARRRAQELGARARSAISSFDPSDYRDALMLSTEYATHRVR